jgi:hypothetical protein
LFGYLAGGGITTGSNNTIIGGNIGGLSASLASNIIIGDGAGNIRAQYNSGWSLAGVGNISAGQYPGIASNTPASAGNIGEIFSTASDDHGATVAITIASPAVITWTAHGLVTGSPVTFTTSGALPTGITANTNYYAIKIDANTFNVATSVDNAFTGTKVNTSGSQSGTQAGTNALNLTDALTVNLTGLQLSAGQYMVSGLISYAGGTTTTIGYAIAGTNSISQTFGGIGSYIQYGFPAGYVIPAASGSVVTFPAPPTPYSCASTCTIYLLPTMHFGTSTSVAYGQMQAVRYH